MLLANPILPQICTSLEYLRSYGLGSVRVFDREINLRTNLRVPRISVMPWVLHQLPELKVQWNLPFYDGFVIGWESDKVVKYVDGWGLGTVTSYHDVSLLVSVRKGCVMDGVWWQLSHVMTLNWLSGKGTEDECGWWRIVLSFHGTTVVLFRPQTHGTIGQLDLHW